MPREHRARTRRTKTIAAVAAATALAAAGLAANAGASPATPDDAPRAAAGETLFDDFDYTSHDDPKLGEHGWTARGNSGGPGVPGASWAADNVTFADDGGNSIMNLEASSAGTPETTEQAELLSDTMKFKNGTYAARVKFSDEPKSGPDGDRQVQTFFALNDLTAPMADDYSEYDFEYLPNGGWGEDDHVLFTTSYETYNPDPWETVTQVNSSRDSLAGWHDLVFTIDDSNITYYLDGAEFGKHDAKYLPERPMGLYFNHWLIDLEGQTSTEPRAYDQQVDYVLHVKDQVLSPAEVTSKVEEYRAAGTSFEDTVPNGAGASDAKPRGEAAPGTHAR
ncbi:glycosyl hydrolase family protein [Streptomyces sp. Z26]|nr:glycosyl hydrolase family protein [Streptomyces sp. Z26]